MILDSGGFSNAYTCGIRQGGAFELKQATWAYGQAIEAAKAAGDERQLAALEAEPLHDWFNAMPWSEGRSPLRASPHYEAYLLEQWRLETFDAHWKQIGIYAAGFYDAIPPVPVALMSSWFDAYVPTTFENHAGFARAAGRPLTLIMGAGLHGDRNTTFAGDVDFGAEASFDGHVAPSWLEFRRLWFDRWIKQRQEPASAAPVNIFLMGGGSGCKTKGRLDHGGRWISAERWPLPGMRPQSYFLHPAGRLSTQLVEGAAAPLSYSFDPDRPVPTIGGALTSGKPVFAGGAFDQREDARFFGCVAPELPLAARRDVLSFESEPLAEDMAVVGPVTVTLFAATDGLDTDFTAKLIDVYPPSTDYPAGFAMNLTDGIIRSRLRHGDGIPRQTVPGQTMELTIGLFATANLFKAGHRIRLDISSSNFPKFDVNPNTGEPAGVGRARRVARNTVFLDQAHPSRLEIAVMG
jgi:putative CocE/NonD family hydrolase